MTIDRIKALESARRIEDPDVDTGTIHFVADAKRCAHALLAEAPEPAYVDIVFDGPPSHESGRFVEVEDATGKSINFGRWLQREDGYWALRIPSPSPAVRDAPARIIAHKGHADLPGTWRARKIRYGSFALEVELPCINGLSAWFSVATFDEADEEERLITDGARQEAGEYAAKFAALAAWMESPKNDTKFGRCARALLAEAPVRDAPLREALEHVRGIIMDAAKVGFNWQEGDWAERLFASQAITKAALSPSIDKVKP